MKSAIVLSYLAVLIVPIGAQVIDTLSIAERLIAAGAEETIAKAIAHEFATSGSDLVTKTDLIQVEQRLEQRLGRLEGWFFGVIVALFTLAVPLIIKLIGEFRRQEKNTHA